MRTATDRRTTAKAWRAPVLGGALGGLAMLAAVAPAQALVLLPATLKVAVAAGVNAETITTNHGPALDASDSGDGATEHASIQVSPSVLLTTSSASGDDIFSGGHAQANLTYYFGVTGPADLVVPIHMLA